VACFSLQCDKIIAAASLTQFFDYFIRKSYFSGTSDVQAFRWMCPGLRILSHRARQAEPIRALQG
jgi:hypothetical protein